MNTQLTTKLRSTLLALFLGIIAVSQTLAQKPELVVQAGHRGMIRVLALSPDNNRLASAGADGEIIIWDINSRKQVLTLRGHVGWIYALAFSKDGRLASGSYDGIVKIWNMVTAKLEFEITSVKPYSITSLAFSADGNSLAIASADKIINLWDVQTRERKSQLKGHSDKVTQVAFSSDGKKLMSSSLDQTLRTWDLTTGESEPLDFEAGVAGFAISPNKKFLALNLTKYMILILYRPGEIPEVRGISFQGFPKVEGLVEALDVKFFQRVLGTPLCPPGALAFISDTELAFVDGPKLRVWDVQAEKEKFSREIKSSEGAYDITFNKTKSLLIYNDGATIELFNPASGTESQLQGGFGVFSSVAISSNGQVLSGEFSNTIKLGYFSDTIRFWNANSKAYLPEDEVRLIMPSLFKDRNSSNSQIGLWSLDAIVKINSADITLQRWNTDETLFVLKGHSKDVESVAVNQQETVLASSSKDETILLWDLETRKPIKKLDAKAQHIQFSPDGNSLVTVDEDNVLKLWDISDSGKNLATINLNTRRGIAFSPNSEMIATQVLENSQEDPTLAKDEAEPNEIEDKILDVSLGKRRRVLKLWKVATGELLHSFNTGATPEDFNLTTFKSTKANFEPSAFSIFADIVRFKTSSGPVAFSTDNNFVACSVVDHVTGTNQLKIWDIVTGKVVHTLEGHTSSIRSVAFSPDKKILVSAGWDRTLKFWNLITGKEAATLILFNKEDWVIFTPDGRFDTNLNLDNTANLIWTWPDDALQPLSVRVFVRDYYEPMLLRKILAGEELRSVRNLSTLNRTQPLVRITKVKPDGTNTVQVTVEVASTLSNTQFDPSRMPLSSGVFDVKLFRNGQMVRSSTTDEILSDYFSTAAPLKDTQEHVSKELELWRKANEVKLDGDGKARLTFYNIKLPRDQKLKEVSFSAYAFNSDRVTSDSFSHIYKLPPVTEQVTRRAYLITVGVDANQSGWDLDFATKSAENMHKLLIDKLSGEFEVTNVSLLSMREPDSPRMALNHATKENIRTVLNILAGKVVDDEGRKKIPNASALRAATPDDLIVLYIASHGYVDPQGNFYIIPSNTGRLYGVTKLTLDDCLAKFGPSPRCDAQRLFLNNSISGDDLTGWWRGVDAGEMVMILDSCHSAALPGKDFKPGPLGDRNFGQLSYDKGIMVLAATQPDKAAFSTMRGGVNATLLSNVLVNYTKAYPQATFPQLLENAEYNVPTKYRELYPDIKEDNIQYPVFFDFKKKR